MSTDWPFLVSGPNRSPSPYTRSATPRVSCSHTYGPSSATDTMPTERSIEEVSTRPVSSTNSTCQEPSVRTRAVNDRSEEHTSELQSRGHLVCRLLLEKKKT